MYIIDTHTLLWFLYDSDQISEKAKALICEAEEVYVSIVSLWEIAIKQGLGKLKNKDSIKVIADVCGEKDIQILSILPNELEEIKHLPDIHRDPFDRLLIAQAKVKNMTIITRDAKMAQYDCVNTVW